MSSIRELEQRAVTLVKAGVFDLTAVDVNQRILSFDPVNRGALNRLARCFVEAGQLEDAEGACLRVLEHEPANTIARHRLEEVRAGRAMNRGPSTSFNGFGADDFEELAGCRSSESVARFKDRMADLCERLEDLVLTERVKAARGSESKRLFGARNLFSGGAGHLFLFQVGGRWEPQFNIGLFSARQWKQDWLRIGLGFNLTAAGRDPNPQDGLERLTARFLAFQEEVRSASREWLTRWLRNNDGYVQRAGRGPEIDWKPARAVEWLGTCPATQKWVFVGRWLTPQDPEQAAVLASPVRLVGEIARVWDELAPLWHVSCANA